MFKGMEDSNITLSLLGGWSEKTNQDFQYGAKTESFLSHASASPQHQDLVKDVKNEWLNNYDYLGESFNPFEDVLIPDGISIDPDEMFKEFENVQSIEFVDSPKGSGLSANPLPSGQDHFNPNTEVDAFIQSPVSFQHQATFEPQTFEIDNSKKQIKLKKNPSRILINLKKVKVVHPTKTTHDVQVVTSSKPNPSQEVFTTDDCLNVINETTKIKDPEMTLKDFLKVGCADDILDELMEVVPQTEGRDIDQLTSYICNESDSSSGSESPSYSSSDSTFSPTFSPEYINTSDDNLDFSTIDEDALFSLSMPSTSSRRSYKSISKAKLSIEEKKSKKMEQNKKAATRYRAKKKRQEMEVMEKLKVEEDRHNELTTKYKGLRQEVKLMKKIMRDLFIAQGIISADAFKK